MQKLIRRTPSAPALLSTSSLKPSLPFLSLSLSLPLPFTTPASSSTISFSMPTATLPGCGSSLAVTVALTNRTSSLSRRFYTTASYLYQPCLNTRTSLRAWPGRVGIRPAWCHSSGIEEQLSPIETSKDLNEIEQEDKPIRLNGRQKGSGVLVESPDLLTIPGVGPRNLRKLVENGIQGVAELKQLYKDKERESSGGLKPLRLMERSVFSDRMVFVRAVHEANWRNEMEISIYDSWFDPVVSCLPGLSPDGFIYQI